MFKIGDRVQVTQHMRGWRATFLQGKVGTIICLVNNYYGVQFDEPSNLLHRLDQRLTTDTGWWFKASDTSRDLDLVDSKSKEEKVLNKIRYLNERFNNRLRGNDIPKRESVQSTEQRRLSSYAEELRQANLDVSNYLTNVDIGTLEVRTLGLYGGLLGGIQPQVRSRVATTSPQWEREIHGPSW